MTKLQSIYLPVLTAIGLIASAAIAIAGHPVPAQLWTINYTLVGGTLGVNVPTAAAAVVSRTVSPIVEVTPVAQPQPATTPVTVQTPPA